MIVVHLMARQKHYYLKLFFVLKLLEPQERAELENRGPENSNDMVANKNHNCNV